MSTYKVKKPTPVGQTTTGTIKLPTSAILGFGSQAGATAPDTGRASGSGTVGTKGFSTPQAAAAQSASPPPAAGLPAGVTDTVPSKAPPPTVDSQTSRINALQGYNANIPDTDYQLYNAAFDYGGVPTVDEWDINNPTTDQTGRLVEGADTTHSVNVVANPNSQVAVLGRQLPLDILAQNQAANAANSYFSGGNLEKVGQINDQYGRNLLSAKEAYESAIEKLNSAIIQAQEARHAAFRTGNASDADAAAAQPPVAVATPQATPPPAGTPTPTAAHPVTGGPAVAAAAGPGVSQILPIAGGPVTDRSPASIHLPTSAIEALGGTAGAKTKKAKKK